MQVIKAITIVLLFACASCNNIDSFLGREGNDRDSDGPRPTDEGEGFPGYLVNPEELVKIEYRDDDSIVAIEAEAGTVVAGDGPVEEVPLEVWQVTAEAVAEAVFDESGVAAIPAEHRLSIKPSADGSFSGEFAYSDKAPILITIADDPAAAVATVRQADAADKLKAHVIGAALPTVKTQPGIWFSLAEIAVLEAAGAPWDEVLRVANLEPGAPNLSEMQQPESQIALASAYVYVKTGDESYRAKVEDLCTRLIGTGRDETGGNAQATARGLFSYVVAADIVGLSDAARADFSAMLRSTLSEPYADGMTVTTMQEERGSHAGRLAGASRAAVALYLGDAADLARAAQVFKGWLGDRQAYSAFDYGSLDWQADQSRPVGINPPGAMLGELAVGGAIAVSLASDHSSPELPLPGWANSSWGALQGAVAMAETLTRAGYNAWQWSDKALLRAVDFLQNNGAPAPDSEDDQWVLWVINKRYGSAYDAAEVQKLGKNMAFTSWTHR